MDLLHSILAPVLVAAAYALGSVPFGLVLTRRFTDIDIQNAGSGNIGATNVRRLAGNKLGLATLAGDVLKGAIPVGMAVWLLPSNGEFWVALTALAAFAGHLHPIYLGFRGGGKGVATAAGALLPIAPMAVLAALLVFILVVCMTSRVSAGSLAGSAALPLAVWEAAGASANAWAAGIMAVWIAWRHRENIGRLLKGVEPRI
ncbi:MAG: glycerol-3-phosphate 1-O-acyltransferase PlsY [Desulfococcaceae bacterium]